MCIQMEKMRRVETVVGMGQVRVQENNEESKLNCNIL
jgi:hypothetical protein